MRIIQIIFLGILTSFFLFPADFVFLPSGANTKILLALLGILIAVYNATANDRGMVSKPIINLSTYGGLFSLVCFISTVYNETSDFTYATYIVTMWIWAMAAYAVCQIMQSVHGKVTFDLIARYLVGVCVGQCVFALLIDNYPGIKSVVTSIFWIATDFFEQGGRLYGIGCALDPAGIRFSVVLILLANLIVNVKEKVNLQLFLYMFSFAVIVIVGNMIARTTIVGAVMAIAYVVFTNFTEHRVDGRVWQWFVGILLIAVPFMTFLYYTNPTVREDLRFAFEGFFSLAEKGHWETHSNNELEKMVRWPEELKTWIIGDGYFVSPWSINPYYTGDDVGAFYKNTDIGYCRFIFYCGTIGLAVFSAFFTKVTMMCADLFPKRKLCLFTILMVNFIVWAKVATDIFLVFALLFFTEADEEDEEEEEYSVTLYETEKKLSES